MKRNEGAVVTGSRNLEKLVAIENIPYPQLEDDMIIVKAIAYAVNPTDWKHIFPESFASHLTSEFAKKFGLGIAKLESPLGKVGSCLGYFIGKNLTIVQKGVVVGSDISGIVEEVGKNVTGFKKGDIVCGSLHGGMSKNGGFSKYVKISTNALVKFSDSQILKEALSQGTHPSTIINSFEAAASLPVGLKTVALSFHENFKIPTNKDENKNDYILIWGGATATGILAIQVAKLLYGLNVITTASKKNHSALISYGADKVFDYNDERVIEKLKKAGEGRIKYGLDCVSTVDTFQSVYDATEGSEDVCVDNLLFLNQKAISTKSDRKVRFAITNGYLIDGRKHFGEKFSAETVKSFQGFWNTHFLSVIDKIKTAPLEVLPVGLQSANEGLRLLIENKVSGKKIVFRNEDE